MSAKCSCGLYWNISIKQQIPKSGYECPHCASKRKSSQEVTNFRGARKNELQVNNIKN